MEKIILSKENMARAHTIAAYLDCPQRTSYSEKEKIWEAVTLNPDIWYEALNINLRKWRRKKI